LDDGSKIHRDWLSFSPNLDKAFCLHRMLFGINLNSMSSMVWTKKGFSTWKNGNMCIKSHECSEDHITSSIKVKTRKICLPLLPLLENKNKMEIAQNRQTVSDLINVTIFLAQHNMAFRGHRENWSRKHSKGNFKDLVLLMAQHSSSLQQHVELIKSSGKKEVSFLSWRRQNTLIECISNNIALTIQEAIKTSGVFSISIDSTFDSARKEQVPFIVRYVCKTTGVVNERLIAMRESPYTSGVELFNLFKEVMAKNNLDWINNLIG